MDMIQQQIHSGEGKTKRRNKGIFDDA